MNMTPKHEQEIQAYKTINNIRNVKKKKVYKIKNCPMEMLYKTNKVMLQPFSAFQFCVCD